MMNLRKILRTLLVISTLLAVPAVGEASATAPTLSNASSTKQLGATNDLSKALEAGAAAAATDASSAAAETSSSDSANSTSVSKPATSSVKPALASTAVKSGQLDNGAGTWTLDAAGTVTITATSADSVFKGFYNDSSLSAVFEGSGATTVNKVVLANKMQAAPDFSAGFFSLKATSIDGLANLDTSHVTTMKSVFNSADNLTNLDLSSWDVSHVTSIETMFQNASGLTDLNLSNWQISSLKVTANAFKGTDNLTNLNLAGFKTGPNALLFFDTLRYTTADDIAQPNKAANKSVQTVNLANADFTGTTDLTRLLAGMRMLTQVDLTGTNFAGVTSIAQMFTDCKDLKKLDFSVAKNLDSVTSVRSLAYYCPSLTSFVGFKNDKITTVYQMFMMCNSLVTADLSGLNLANVIDPADFGNMLSSCTALTSVIFNGDFKFPEKYIDTATGTGHPRESILPNMSNRRWFAYKAAPNPVMVDTLASFALQNYRGIAGYQNQVVYKQVDQQEYRLMQSVDLYIHFLAGGDNVTLPTKVAQTDGMTGDVPIDANGTAIFVRNPGLTLLADKLPQATRPGYRFDYWESVGSGKPYVGNIDYADDAQKHYAAFSLKAIWKSNIVMPDAITLNNSEGTPVKVTADNSQGTTPITIKAASDSLTLSHAGQDVQVKVSPDTLNWANGDNKSQNFTLTPEETADLPAGKYTGNLQVTISYGAGDKPETRTIPVTYTVANRYEINIPKTKALSTDTLTPLLVTAQNYNLAAGDQVNVSVQENGQALTNQSKITLVNGTAKMTSAVSGLTSNGLVGSFQGQAGSTPTTVGTVDLGTVSGQGLAGDYATTLTFLADVENSGS